MKYKVLMVATVAAVIMSGVAAVTLINAAYQVFQPVVTVANLPASPFTGQEIDVSDGTGVSPCTGGGTIKGKCRYNGAIWEWFSGGGGGGASFVSGAIQFATSTTAARATTVTDVVNLWTACGSNFLKGDGTCAAAGGGGGGVAYNLLGAVCQLTAGKSLNGSFPAANAPTPDCVSGSITTPQSGRALFAQNVSLGATPSQWVDQQFILPNPLTGTYSLVVKVQNDIVITGIDYVSFQYVCAADGATALPTYSSVQSFSVTVPGTANTFATITATPTIASCSAGNVMYTRLGAVTGSSVPTTNNLAIHTAMLFVK